MVKSVHSIHKKTHFSFVYRVLIIIHTGNLVANNRHLTSFAVGLRRRSFVQNVCAGVKNLHTTSLESAVRNEYKYQLNPQKWRARFSGKIWMKFELKWRRSGKQLRNKIWRSRRNPKSKMASSSSPISKMQQKSS